MSRWLDHAPVPMGVLQNGRLTYCNESFARLVGRSSSELIGTAFADLIASEDRERALASEKREVRLACDRLVEVFVSNDGDETIVQMCDRGSRAEFLAKLFRIGVEVQAGHPVAAIFERVAARLAELGIASGRFIPGQESLEVANVAVPVDSMWKMETIIGAPLVGLKCRWSPELRSAMDHGSSYVTDVSHHSAAMLGAEIEEPARILLAELELSRGVIVRIDLADGPSQLWMMISSRIQLDDVPAFELFAAQIGAALEAGRVIGDLFARNASLAAINRLASVASAATGPDDLFESFAVALHAAIPCDAVSLLVVDEATDELVLAYQYGLPLIEGTPKRWPIEGTAIGTVVRSGIPAIHHVKEASARVRRLLDAYSLSLVANVPLVARSKTIGLLNVSRVEEREFTEPDLELMQAAGAHLASAVEANRLFVDLKKSYADLARTQEQLVQRERLAAIGELAAVVAHEVRNPLGVIFNSIGTIRRLLGDDERVWTLVRILEEEATRLNHIVGDLLDFARPRIPTLQRDRIEAVLEEAVAAALASSSGVRVVREIESELPAVPMDARLMRQALLNVAQNAVQAMPEGGTLTVRVKRATAFVAVEIEDTGPGIPPEIRPRIFEPFFTTRARGTGLGLAVVKRIVDGHGGDIELATEVGRGTRFSVSLPVDP